MGFARLLPSSFQACDTPGDVRSPGRSLSDLAWGQGLKQKSPVPRGLLGVSRPARRGGGGGGGSSGAQVEGTSHRLLPVLRPGMWGFRTGPWGKQGAQTTATSPLRAVCGDVPHSQHCPSAGYRARMGLEWRGWAEAGSLRTPSLFPWIAGQFRCLGVRSDSWLPREVTVSVCVVGAPTGPGPGAGLRPSALYLAPSRSLWLYAAPPPAPTQHHPQSGRLEAPSSHRLCCFSYSLRLGAADSPRGAPRDIRKNLNRESQT